MNVLTGIRKLWQRASRVADVKNRKLLMGFGVIELLVVVAVISVLMGIAISNFPQISLQLALTRAAHTFAGELRKTQQMALSGLRYKDEEGVVREVSGYGIYIDLLDGGKTYVRYADKAPGNKQYDSGDYVVQTIDFSSTERGIIMKEVNNVASGQVSINFSSSLIETKITPLLSHKRHAEFIFALESEMSTQKEVWVNTAGLIEVK